MFQSLYYEDTGEGKPVLFLHGWGGCAASFAPVIQHMRAGGYRTVALDFPGHGKTPEPDGAWGVDEYMEHTARLIEELGIAPCHIVAHSFGARVAIMLAQRYPDYVDKLLLTGAAGVIPKRGFKYYVKVYSYKLGKRLSAVPFLDRALHLSEKAKNAGSEDYRALTDNMKRIFVRVVNKDLTPYLSKIKAPALLIWGDKDESTPIYMARVMEKNIPDSALVVFEGAGHFAYLEELHRFCVIADAFFGGK